MRGVAAFPGSLVETLGVIRGNAVVTERIWQLASLLPRSLSHETSEGLDLLVSSAANTNSFYL